MSIVFAEDRLPWAGCVKPEILDTFLHRLYVLWRSSVAEGMLCAVANKEPV